MVCDPVPVRISPFVGLRNQMLCALIIIVDYDRKIVTKRKKFFFMTKPFILFLPANSYVIDANKEGHNNPSHR